MKQIKKTSRFLNVGLSGSKLTADLHTKFTDKHQYLHYTSSHPAHTKRSIIYRQALRMSRIFSNKTDFEKHPGSRQDGCRKEDTQETWFKRK